MRKVGGVMAYYTWRSGPFGFKRFGTYTDLLFDKWTDPKDKIRIMLFVYTYCSFYHSEGCPCNPNDCIIYRIYENGESVQRIFKEIREAFKK